MDYSSTPVNPEVEAVLELGQEERCHRFLSVSHSGTLLKTERRIDSGFILLPAVSLLLVGGQQEAYEMEWLASKNLV